MNITKNSVAFFLFNIVLFGLVSDFVFSYRAANLLPGNDGPMLLMLALDKMRYIGQTLDLHSNFLQGIGNLSFPINPALLPAFWFDAYNASGIFFPVLMFVFFALITFITVLLVGWNHGFSRNHTFGAAWLLSILVLPFYGKYFAVYPVSAQAPVFLLYLFCGALADIALWRMGRRSLLNTAAFAGLLIFAILLLLVISPAAILIIAPYLLVSGAVSLVAAGKRERLHKMAACVAVLIIALAAGWLEYVAGLFLYSSGTFFFNEMTDSYPPSRQFGSILYQGRIVDRAVGPVLFVLGTIGALYGLRKKDTHLRYAAIITLVGGFLHGFLGAEFIHRSGGWSGPPPIYSEMLFYALYALFFVTLLARGLQRFFVRFSSKQMAYGLPLCVVLLVCGSTLFLPPELLRDASKNYPMPPASNEITDILEKEIALPPGALFSGRVATVIPANQAWQSYYASRLNGKIGNDMLTNGLWFKNIPTLTEYNQLISPRFYLLIKNFLVNESIDPKQNRSWTNFTRVDVPILRLLGVRFLLSTEAYIDGLEKRSFIAPDGLETLRLYDIPRANINGIAAKRVELVTSINAAVAVMKQDGFELETAVIVTKAGEHLEERVNNLVPVIDSQIRVEQGAYHVTAQSKGRSLLILPIELSHCTDMKVLAGDAPELMKVDVALTGVFFDKKLDISLVQQTGAFHNPRCRLKDYQQFKAEYGRDL